MAGVEEGGELAKGAREAADEPITCSGWLKLVLKIKSNCYESP